MTKDEFKRHLKATTHTRQPGGNRPRSKRAASAEIELLTRDFLAGGGQIDELCSEHQRSHWKPAFNHNPHESGDEV